MMGRNKKNCCLYPNLDAHGARQAEAADVCYNV